MAIQVLDRFEREARVIVSSSKSLRRSKRLTPQDLHPTEIHVTTNWLEEWKRQAPPARWSPLRKD